VNSSLDFF
jgi:hypothetical protein